MRKIISNLIIISLFFSFNLSKVFAENEEGFKDSPTFIKVGLNYTSSGETSILIGSEKNLAIWNFADNSQIVTLQDINKARISIENGKLNAVDEFGNELIYEKNGENLKVSDALETGYFFVSQDYIEYINSDIKDFDSIIKLNSKNYRGGMGFYVNANNTFKVVNKLTIDEYTYGVINGEMNYSNPQEALKVQAVVVRSYALTNIGRHGSNGFDVCDSTHCQLYRGYSDEHSQIKDAVDETANLGIYYENQPVSAYFYKNSGGYTQNVEDVWNSKLGYLRSVKDEFSPIYNWEAEFTLSQLESKLKVAGYKTGTLKSVSIIETNEAGSVSQLEFIGLEGKAILTKEKIRTILGMTAIKSTRFQLISDNEEPIFKEPTRNLFVRGNILSNISRDDMYLINGSGNKGKINGTDVFVLTGGSVNKLFTEEKIENIPVSGDVITFKGTGAGHGVGLPQDSAIAMAKAGFEYKEILNYYYTDIEIK